MSEKARFRTFYQVPWGSCDQQMGHQNVHPQNHGFDYPCVNWQAEPLSDTLLRAIGELRLDLNIRDVVSIVDVVMTTLELSDDD